MDLALTQSAASPLPPGELLVINQVVGPMMVQLLEDLQHRGAACTAVAGHVEVTEGQAVSFRVIRACPLEKAPAWRRIWTWGKFALQACREMIRRPGASVLVVSNPPITALAMPLLKRLLGLRYVVLIYDVYPDVAERAGMTGPPWLVGRLWRMLSRSAMLAADGVVTIGQRMADRLATHLRRTDRLAIEVIPNWADTSFVKPMPKADNAFAREHGLVDKLVVTYSGAFGATHDVESIIEAAGLVTDLEDVHFMLIGGGTRLADVQGIVNQRKLPNLTLLPLQPWDVVPLSFAAVDVAIVCLDEGYEGMSVPSKTYYALAAGSAILAISPPATELTDLVAQEQCGYHVLPRHPQEIAAVVRRYHARRDELARAQQAARQAAEMKYSHTVVARQYSHYLSRTLGKSGLP